MNRETKRMMERRGGSTAEGAELETEPFEIGDVGVKPRAVRAAGPRRTTPIQFAREIRDELRQVAWPTRDEMVTYSVVVFVTLILMVALIYVLNYAFGHGVVYMFQK
ncbi:MAG: preprotein translocase subunit SecE [Acidimicrobiales bacterium]